MAQEKKYLPVFGKVKTFDNGGEIEELSAKADELIKFIQDNKNSAGYFNFNVSKQKNDPTKLSVSLNTFEPKSKDGSSNSVNSDLPF